MNPRNKIILLLVILLSILLRLPYLDRFPPALYSDEANQGYNAYSIIKTGKDEHGVFLPISFRSFGDWKPPLQTYLMIPTIILFGLTEFSIRLPSALLGVLSIFLSCFLVKELFYQNRSKEKLALLSAFLLSISPWHLHQSRSAMLIMVALFFFMLGLYYFLISLKKPKYLYFSVISFILAIYSYYGMRLIIPIFCLFLLIKNFRYLVKLQNKLLISLIIGFILLLPLIIGFLYEPSIVFGRAKNVSIFFDRGVKLRLAELQTGDGVSNIPSQVSLFFHNKPYLYSLDIIKRFFVHFDGQFLFLKGDTASPFRIPNMGVLYLIESVFLPIGLFFLIKNKEKNKAMIIIWLILAVIPGALSFLTPTHNRTFNAVFPMVVLIAYGLLSIFKNIKLNPIILSLILSLSYVISFNFYLNNYYKILPLHYGADWLYGFRDVINYINKEDKNFSKIIFLPKTSMSYIYILFYNKYPPGRFQIEAKHDYVPDNLGFEYVKGFNKYSFYNIERSREQLKHSMIRGEMYIGREEEIPKSDALYNIYYPDGKVAFRITYLD